MIPRYQRILYWTLVGAIFLMGCILLRGCVRDHQRMIAQRDLSPIPAPADTPPENVTVANANDADGTLNLDQATLSLPQEPSTRAAVLLNHVLSAAARPNSPHPVPAGPAVLDVFFVPLPIQTPTPAGSFGVATEESTANGNDGSSPYGQYHAAGAMLAVVNLSKAFADAHPSGIETEDLTLRSMLATLHANFPQVEDVRFLVDGDTRETLAGHAVLDRVYPATSAITSVHPLSADGSPE